VPRRRELPCRFSSTFVKTAIILSKRWSMATRRRNARSARARSSHHSSRRSLSQRKVLLRVHLAGQDPAGPAVIPAAPARVPSTTSFRVQIDEMFHVEHCANPLQSCYLLANVVIHRTYVFWASCLVWPITTGSDQPHNWTIFRRHFDQREMFPGCGDAPCEKLLTAEFAKKAREGRKEKQSTTDAQGHRGEEIADG
jgi:hypothetical protein